MPEVDAMRVGQATGFASLLSEIYGKGILHKFGDQDLICRVEDAINDNEHYIRQRIGIEQRPKVTRSECGDGDGELSGIGSVDRLEP
jgi:hypothetical protein